MSHDDSAARRAQVQAAQINQQIDTALARDPAFRVLAVDGLAWICPYTGTAVQAPFGWEEPAKQWLLQQQPWKTRKPSPLAEVQRQRWRLWLRAQLEAEGRLRLFGADGRWLNPFTGHWARLGWKPGDPPTAFVEEASAVLVGCAEAQSGKMLDRNRLDAVMHERGFSSGTRAAEHTPSSPTRTISRPGGGSGDSALSLQGDERAAMMRAIERMLPDLPQVPGFAFAAHHEPCANGGNDFHVSATMADGRLLLGIGSILGTGTPNALAMPVALKTAMGAIPRSREPLEVLRAVGGTMRAMLAPGQGVGLHLLVIDPAKRTCVAVCAGLRPAIRLNLGRRDVLMRVDEPGPALIQVAEADLAHELRGVSFALEPGDTILLWSDGLPRAADLKRTPYGDHRAMATLLGNFALPLDDLIARLAGDARSFTSDVFREDVSILALRVA